LNALTKAFVVVVTILAVVLVALVVPFAARVPDYAQQYQDLQAQAKAAELKASKAAESARAKIAADGEAQKLAAQENESLSTENETLRANVKSLQAKIAQTQAALDQSVAANQVLVNTNENKDALLAERAGLIEKQLGTLGELQSQLGDVSQTLIAVRAENRRLSDNYLRIQEVNKALTRQLEEKTAQVEDLKKRWIALGGDEESLDTNAGVVGPAIKGSVVKIEQVSDGMTFVQVNVGKRDNVKPGMEFTVYRGDKFVGKVKIDTVDTADAVGKVTLGGGLQEGDAVRAGGR
jgi:septal ring factor EnvC (AmiA/AmiB activator)